jgi:hypothetical protein
VATLTYPTIEHVAMQARPYPTHLLENAETGLVLFAAQYLGHNDAVHFALENVLTTCVDVNSARLEEMEPLYPEDWRFVCDDAWTYAERHSGQDQWDVVSVDTYRGDAEARSLKSLELWCSLARVAVTVTLSNGLEYQTPTGFKGYEFVRAPGVYWLVLERQ